MSDHACIICYQPDPPDPQLIITPIFVLSERLESVISVPYVKSRSLKNYFSKTVISGLSLSERLLITSIKEISFQPIKMAETTAVTEEIRTAFIVILTHYG